MRPTAPIALLVLDGWGIAPPGEGNAVSLARTPHLDRLLKDCPHTVLEASGEAVGLPEGQMGNSEVGHLNLGAGRIVYQDLTRINRSIRRGDFFRNPVLREICERMTGDDSRSLHILGLVSDGGVHSHLEHIRALCELAKQAGVRRLHIHAFLDGRDTPPTSAPAYLAELEDFLHDRKIGDVATVCGRYYAMDRDRRWSRTEKAYRALVLGEGARAASSREAVDSAYARGETDEFVSPTVIVGPEGTPRGTIRSGDGVIFANFRADRAREITRALADPQFSEFERGTPPDLLDFVTMAEYDATFPYPAAFPPDNLTRTLGEVYSEQGCRQLRIAETEKYAHVTYFFSGGREEPFDNEDRVLIPSPQEVATYDQKPEMSAVAVTDAVVSRIEANRYQLIVLNYANLDMVGHTGIVPAAVTACQTVDEQVGRVVAALARVGGTAIITADHGNAECMIDPEGGGAHTAHTANKVHCIFVDAANGGQALRPQGILADVAPTILQLADLPQPQEMTGESLLAP